MSKNYMNDSQASEIMKYISDTMKLPIMGAGGGFAPIGTINSYMGTVAPIGWLVCDGTVYNIADYPDLATHIASQFGSTNFFGGNGTTTFGVPDLRGEFLRGSGTNSHANQGSGANVGVHQDGTQHTYSYTEPSNGALIYGVGAKNMTDLDTIVEGVGYNAFNGTIQQGSNINKFFTSRPTNTSVLFIIKATVSDAEINAFNVYTPREHQVAWWEEEIDGVWKRKPVYEQTVESNNGISLSANSWTGTSISASTMEQMIDIIGYNTSDKWVHKALMCSLNGSGGVLEIYNCRGTCILHKITIRYTKTTDQWQTS